MEGCAADKAEEEEDALAMFSNASSEAALRILLNKKATALAQGVKIFALRLISLCSRHLFFHVLSAALVKQVQEEETSKESVMASVLRRGKAIVQPSACPYWAFFRL